MDTLIDLDTVLVSMASFPVTLAGACAGLSTEQSWWKPPSGAWSVLEIVGHLVIEEAEDFRVRVLSTLEDPARPWANIDPEGAVRDRRCNELDLHEQLAHFARERAESVQLLRALHSPDWNRTHHHPTIGPLRAGDLMLSWGVHDALHLRQIAKRRYEMLLDASEGFSSAYAGSW